MALQDFELALQDPGRHLPSLSLARLRPVVLPLAVFPKVEQADPERMEPALWMVKRAEHPKI